MVSHLIMQKTQSVIIRKSLCVVNRWAIYHLRLFLSFYIAVKVELFWLSALTNDNLYHMILFIIIVMKGRCMLNRALGSAWGVLLPGVILGGLMFADLSIESWKAIIVSGLLMTSGMIWHKQLRHFVLLPSCVALVSGILVILMSLK